MNIGHHRFMYVNGLQLLEEGVVLPDSHYLQQGERLPGHGCEEGHRGVHAKLSHTRAGLTVGSVGDFGRGDWL
jgi:hypothetical protein